MMHTKSAAVAALLVTLTAWPTNAQTTISLTSEEAVARAIQTSHRLAEARAREAGAQAAVRARAAADQPSLNVSATYTRTSHVEEFGVVQPNGTLRVIFPDIPDNLLTRTLFQWPIYTAGRSDALQRAAEAEARATSAEVAIAQADLRLEVIRSYWALATATESEEVLQQALDRADAHLRDVRSRFESGLIPPNEVASAEAQRSRQAMQVIEAHNLRSSVLEDLRRLTGITADITAADGLDTSFPQAAAAAIAAGAQASPDTSGRAERQALAARIIAADERRRAIEAGRRPTITLSGALDYSNPNPRVFPRRAGWREWWEVSATANWTLWDGGRIAAESAEATAAANAVRARLSELDSLIALDVRQRLLDADSARAALVAAVDAVRSAAEARRVVAERFNAGVATSTDVLDAQLALLQAELDRTRALANIRLADARLDRALGR
jgi:outer membrane protein